MTVDHDSWTLDGLIEGWRQHLERTRGLREPTLRGYEWNVRQFVRAALGADPVDPARLDSAAVLAFIVSMSDRFCPSSIVAYLRQGRPTTDERRVFVQHRGPRCGQRLSANAVSEVVARALRRAGVAAPLRGGYVFRHTVASRMVQQGASLKVVADLLGHASLDSVMIYAKLDLPALRAVALPWPGATR